MSFRVSIVLWHQENYALVYTTILLLPLMFHSIFLSQYTYSGMDRGQIQGWSRSYPWHNHVIMNFTDYTPEQNQNSRLNFEDSLVNPMFQLPRQMLICFSGGKEYVVSSGVRSARLDHGARPSKASLSLVVELGWWNIRVPNRWVYNITMITWILNWIWVHVTEYSGLSSHWFMLLGIYSSRAKYMELTQYRPWRGLSSF